MPAEQRSLKELFLLALAVAPTERTAWLERECGHDAELRQHIELMLAAHDTPQSLLDRAPAEPVTGDYAGATECTGTVIGPYTLREQIGEGGFGLVFVAEQMQPVRRKVALKLIKPGMDSRQVIARFEAERQALAIMDHPNIARVFDAGTTASGRPYFVMELVKGVSITQFCDEQRLTPRQRLDLFVDVCSAVQHAHQKGIIHRDLKPSNVMVTSHDGKPVVKVIDFGVAKAIGQQLTEKTIYTQLAQLVGTPLYMSPEQAGQCGQDIDTRSDIYSLGVLLYELLTGTTPFSRDRFKQAAYDEIRRIIREEEPPKPSTRLSDLGRSGEQEGRIANPSECAAPASSLASVSAQRHTEPAKLTKLVRGELDWIVMKALDKDRSRRYETANGFAADVQRYLNDEAVQACPPSAGYRLRKFARRNKGGLAVTALVLFFLVLLGSGVGWAVRDRSARDAEAARQQGDREAKVAGQVESILDEVDRLEREQKWPEALAAARRAVAAVAGGEADAETAKRVLQRLKDLEFIDRLEQIRMEMAASVDGKFAVPSANRAYAQAFRDYGVDVEELSVATSIDRFSSRPALAIPVAAALDDWVTARRVVADKDAPGWLRLVAVARGVDPEPLRDRLRSTWSQPVSQTQDGLRRLAETIDIREQHPATLVSLARTLQGVTHSDAALRLLRDAQYLYPGDFWLTFELGSALHTQGHYEGAIRHYAAAVSIRPNSPVAHNNLGFVLSDQKKPVEAIACYRRAIKLDPNFAMAYSNLGSALGEQKKLDEAIACLHKATELWPDFAAFHSNLGVALTQQGKLDEALDCCRRAIKFEPNFALAHGSLGAVQRAQGKLDDAVAAFQKAIEIDPKNASFHWSLGVILAEQKKLPEALAACEKAIEIDPKDHEAYNNLGFVLREQNRPSEAVAAFRKAIELKPSFAFAHNNLGMVLGDQRKLPEAIAAFQKAIEIDPDYARAYYNLGTALDDLNNLHEAVAAYRKAIEIDPKLPIAHNSLGTVYHQQGKLSEAVAAFCKAIELNPNHIRAHTNLARCLTTCADLKLRNPKEALEVARKGVDLAPQWDLAWFVLGGANYRVGDWNASREALQKSMALEKSPADGSALNLFFMAMNEAKLGKKDSATLWYEKAVVWMERYAPEEQELRGICAEAASVVGSDVPAFFANRAGPTLLSPAINATLTNGAPGGGKLRRWEFKWTEVTHATRYHLCVIGPSASKAIVDAPALTSVTFYLESAGYVADGNRLGWRWKVRAFVNGAWTNWSAEQRFNVAPMNQPLAPNARKTP